MPSFAEAAAHVLQQKQAGWRNPRQGHDWMSSLRRFTFPRIGEMPVSEVTSADVGCWRIGLPTSTGSLDRPAILSVCPLECSPNEVFQ